MAVAVAAVAVAAVADINLFAKPPSLYENKITCLVAPLPSAGINTLSGAASLGRRGG